VLYIFYFNGCFGVLNDGWMLLRSFNNFMISIFHLSHIIYHRQNSN